MKFQQRDCVFFCVRNKAHFLLFRLLFQLFRGHFCLRLQRGLQGLPRIVGGSLHGPCSTKFSSLSKPLRKAWRKKGLHFFLKVKMTWKKMAGAQAKEWRFFWKKIRFSHTLFRYKKDPVCLSQFPILSIRKFFKSWWAETNKQKNTNFQQDSRRIQKWILVFDNLQNCQLWIFFHSKIAKIAPIDFWIKSSNIFR